MPHTICQNCGYYHNREIIDVLKRAEKKKKKRAEKGLEPKEAESPESHRRAESPESLRGKEKEH